MLERREFAAAGLSAIAVAALQGTSIADEPDEHRTHHRDAGRLKKCAEACSACQRECDSCGSHCAMKLKEGSAKHAETLATCQDCADICSAASQIVSRGGPFAELICNVCADACAKCASACDKFRDDKHMRECAAECRRCEKACREMV